VGQELWLISIGLNKLKDAKQITVKLSSGVFLGMGTFVAK